MGKAKGDIPSRDRYFKKVFVEATASLSTRLSCTSGRPWLSALSFGDIFHYKRVQSYQQECIDWRSGI